MNGAGILISTLANQSVDICFANPGTSEMHCLAALDNPRMRSVLCLFEGVATGWPTASPISITQNAPARAW
jgi:acetolactate synthase-1/2/3 large subunit